MSQRQKTVLLVYNRFTVNQKKEETEQMDEKHVFALKKQTKKQQKKQGYYSSIIWQHKQSVYNRRQLSHIYCDVSSLSLLPVPVLLTLLKAQHLVEVKNATPHILHSAKLSICLC